MISNAPIERLINAVMALNGPAAEGAHDAELRCLLRKIEWVATEAETVLRHCAPSTPAAPVGLQHAA